MTDILLKKKFWNSLSKQQKWSLVGLLFFSLFVIIFWFVQLRQRLIYPLYGDMSPSDFALRQKENIASQFGLTEEETIEIYQKNNDADGDTLSDWDELNLYQTSPYLPDSDGDGVDDAVEVKAKTNPNCPEGQICAEDNLIVNSTSESNGTTPDSAGLLDGSTANSKEATENASQLSQAEILRQAFGENPDPDKLRQTLIEAGGDATKLNSISNEELLKAYSQLITQ